MGLALIFQTLIICLSCGYSSKITWLSYILFLIFLGATLVLFIYVASLASDEIFRLSYRISAVIIAPFLLRTPLIIKDELVFSLKLNRELSSMTKSEATVNPILNLRIIYNPTTCFLTAFVILYLLLTLIVVVKLRSSFSGPLRLS